MLIRIIHVNHVLLSVLHANPIVFAYLAFQEKYYLTISALILVLVAIIHYLVNV